MVAHLCQQNGGGDGMTLFDIAWALLKEEGQRRDVKPHALSGLADRKTMSFGEGIDDARAFYQLPLSTITSYGSDAKQRIGPNPSKPNNENDWQQVGHIPFIEGYEAEGYGAYESESNALKDLMNAAVPPSFAQDGFYHPYLHALDYDTNEWVTHLGEDAPPTGDYERIFRAKVIQDGGPLSPHNPIYPDWVWTKIEREQDEDGKHHLTLYTAKYPYSLDELYENLRENPEPYFESGAIQVDDNIQTGEPMSIAWQLLKMRIPNLPEGI